MTTENRCPHCDWDLMAPAAEPPRDLKEVHATEPPKPPYGYASVKLGYERDGDTYFSGLGVYGRPINPGPGYRLLREDEPLPEEEFERFTPSGRWLKSSKCGDKNCCPKNMKSKDWADDPKNHTLAIRVPCETVKPEPVITDAACKNCDCWLVKGWNYCPYCSTARNPELPKPISDLSGLPEGDWPVLAYHPGYKTWWGIKAGQLKANVDNFTHWQPMLPAPVPPPKSQEQLDDEACAAWLNSLPGLALPRPAFKAGIAHARKQGEGK